MANSASSLHPSIDDPTVFVFYRYHPSIAAAVIFFILFLCSTASHIFQMVRLRAWFFVPFVIGGFCELIGYVGRILSSHNQWTLSPYIVQSLLLLIAPTLLSATVYMTLRRIILLTNGESHSIIPARWATRVFVLSDVFAFLMQGTGGGIQATGTLSSMKMGTNIILGGLGVQAIGFGFFLVTIIAFHIRMKRASAAPDVPWKRYIYVLYFASACILVRSLFRIIEYAMGNDGFIMKHEAFLYVFDAVPMFATMAAVNVVHAGRILGKASGKVMGPHGRVENLELSSDNDSAEVLKR